MALQLGMVSTENSPFLKAVTGNVGEGNHLCSLNNN